MDHIKELCNIPGDIIRKNPLILNLTNHVVMNLTANGLLAIGASPLMSIEQDEMEELVQISSAIVINIGTLDKAFGQRAVFAAEMAKKYHKPVILDPVGIGASLARRSLSMQILATKAVWIIRGNASEIIAISDQKGLSKGVDSLHETQDALTSAQLLANEYACAVVISGATDIIVDQKQKGFVNMDVPIMQKVTGMGCMSTAICGACVAVHQDAFTAGLAAMAIMSAAGDKAFKKALGPGSFSVAFMDALADISIADYSDKIHVE